MDKIESTKKIYYDVLPAYNIDTVLTYSSNQVFKVGSLVKISIRKKIFPGCKIITERFFFIPKSYIVFRRGDE